MIRKILALGVMCVLMALSSGCVEISQIDDMYALPQLPNEHLEIQNKIEEVITAGAEYSAPISGTNRSAVQLVDLNNDGTSEAVAYLKVNEDVKPLKIYIFAVDESGEYEKHLVIEGEGTNIDSVTYADMNGDNVSEVIVGWQISSDMKILYAYSIKGEQVSPLFGAEYMAYTTHTMDDNVGADIVVVRMSTMSATGEATLYSMMEDGQIVDKTTNLSNGIVSLSRIRTNYLNDGTPAVYIESTTGSSVVTDLFAYRNGKFENVTMDSETGVSEDTVRTYGVYGMDINGDGVIEIPKPELLPAQSETTNTNYYILKWYTYNQVGERTLAITTYHNYSDGWYLKLPEEWVGNISVRRAEGTTGERSMVFSIMARDGNFVDFLRIYTLTGDNRHDRANQDGKFIIFNNDSSTATIYAGELIVNTENFVLPASIELIKQNFSLIYSEWNTGEL